MRSMVGSAPSRTLPPDERKFVADALIAIHTAILMRYDGRLMQADSGAAHLAGEQTRALLTEYRALKNGGSV